jgi:hypothetical protein
VELDGGTVERWNGGTVERLDHPTDRSRFKSKTLFFVPLVFVSLVVVLARFRAFSRVVIPTEFRPDWARIGWEQIKKTNARKLANAFGRQGFWG